MSVMPLFLLSPLLALSPAFFEIFLVPKLLCFELVGLAGALFLFRRRSWVLPAPGYLYLLASFLGVGLMQVLVRREAVPTLMVLSYGFGGVLIYLITLNLDPRQKDRAWDAILFACLIQIVIVLLTLSGAEWLPSYLKGDHGVAIGTLGNAEFLATLLGVGFFTALHRRQKLVTGSWQSRASTFLVMGLILTLALTRSKGTAIFLVGYLLRRNLPRWPWMVLAGAVLLIVGGILFPSSEGGRILLWLATTKIFLGHFWLGIGPGQLETSYFDTVRQLFLASAGLAHALGPYSSSVSDAHCFPLQSAVEWGLPGLGLSLLFLYSATRIASGSQPYPAACVYLLLFKSLYTVVLGSVTGLLLMAVCLGILTPVEDQRLVVMAGGKRMALVCLALMSLAGGTTFAYSDYGYQRGLHQLFLGEADASLVWLRRSLASRPNAPYTLLAIGHAFYLKKDLEEMDRSLQAALQRQHSMDLFKKSAHMYFYRGMYDRALPLYEDLHRVFPEHRTTMVKLALIHLERREFRQAYELANRVVEHAPRRQSYTDSKNRRVAQAILTDLSPLVTKGALN